MKKGSEGKKNKKSAEVLEKKEVISAEQVTELSTESEAGKKENGGLELVSLENIGKSEETRIGSRKKKKKNYVFGNGVRIAIMFVALTVFCVAGYELFLILRDYKQGEDLYGDLSNEFTTVDLPGEVEQDEGEDYQDDGIMPYNKVNVDFAGLKKANKDVVAWIQFEHVDISYPVVKGTDNVHYLTHTVKNTENKAGSIFMDYQNASDFSDMNTIIYGHNMKNGSMFGLMGKYKKAEFYTGRECFWIYTPQADYRYMIFSCHEPKADDSDVYTFWSAPCEAYGQYLTNAKNMSMYPTGVVELGQEDKIVTLSTCTSRGDDYRFVVQGKLIETIPR